jgi:hypothetical protein
MTAMREAFEKWRYTVSIMHYDTAFEAGWQACLAHIKGQGAVAVIIHKSMGDDLDWDRDGWQPANGFTDLYKLPEDV